MPHKVLIVNETKPGDDELPLTVVHASSEAILGRFTLGAGKSVVIELQQSETVLLNQPEAG